MNTEQLNEFLILSRVLNYSRAADMLYISQPVLTRHIQKLEEELGVSLFRRGSHGVTLTEAGRLLSVKAGPLIGKCNNAANLLNIQNLPVKGQVRIGCAVEISYAAYFHTFIRHFTDRYPDIQLTLEILSNGTPLEMTDAFDLLFTPCNYPQLPSGIRQELIHSHGTYVALTPGHALMTKSLIALHQLAGETLIVPYADEIFGPYAQNWLLAEKHTQKRLSCIKAPNLSTALFLVSIGRGLAIVPRYVKNMVPPETFLVGISNQSCRFSEYLYYKAYPENGAAKLFFEEFRSTHIRTQD